MSASAVVPALPPTPYKGLVPFDDTDSDARFFFGRERETELVAANLMASRLTVLYGPSGVGKSSLLRAGVIRRLRALVTDAPDDNGVAVLVDRWRDEPVAAIAAAAEARMPDKRERLADVLAERIAELGAELYLLLDQMEEYFLYHGRDRGGGPLADELAEALSRPELRVHVLLGIRDDSLSELDAFKARLPGLFANVLRLDHLDRAAARQAIVGPLDEYARLGGPEVVAQPALVEAVLDQVATGRIEQGLAGRGAVAEETDPSRVEAPYLQLVLERLWELERSRGSDVLRAETLAELGGADHIVEQHLERALAPLQPEGREIAARLFHHLVTPSGTKIAHSVDDLARYADTDDGRLRVVINDLVGSRIVRPLPARNGAGPRYEIFHDVLAEAVIAWRTQHETDAALAAERAEARKRHRRLATVAVISVIALAGTTLLAAYAFSERARANDRARTASARELTVASLSSVADDPELALLLALESVAREPSSDAEDALRFAYLADHARAIVDVGRPLLGAAVTGRTISTVIAAPGVTAAAFSDDGRFVARARGLRVEVERTGGSRVFTTRFDLPVVRLAFGGGDLAAAATDGTVVVFTGTGAERFRTKLPNRPTALTLSRDGSLLGAASGKILRVFRLEPVQRLGDLESRSTVLAADFSPDSALVASGHADGGVRLWNPVRGRLVNVFLGHSNQVRALRFTPDGTRLISGSDDRTGRVWRVEDGHVLAVLAGHRDEITSITVTSDGARAVSASLDGTARVWDVVGDAELTVLKHLTGPAPVLDRVDRDGIAVRSGAQLLRLDPKTASVRSRRPAARQELIPGWHVRLDGPVARLTTPEGRELVLRGHIDDVTSVRLSPDGQTLVTASADHDVRLWRAVDGSFIRLLKAHSGRVADARFSPDGRWIVSAGPGVAVWNASSGTRPLFYLRGHEGPVTAAAFGADSRTIVTTGEDGTVRTYACDVCGSVDRLVALARARLALAHRTLTSDERRRYLR